MTVIFRPDPRDRHAHRQPANLQRAHLQRANLRRALLSYSVIAFLLVCIIALAYQVVDHIHLDATLWYCADKDFISLERDALPECITYRRLTQ